MCGEANWKAELGDSAEMCAGTQGGRLVEEGLRRGRATW